MRKLILITGDLATGKSTFGRILAKRYGCTMLCKDKIKELLAETVGFSSREENRRLSVAAVEAMIHCFSEITESSSDLILEANFRGDEMKKLYYLANESGYDMLTLYLSADIEIIYRRFVNRIENENRHPAHICGFDGYDSFVSAINLLRNEERFGKIIDISADDFGYQTDKYLLEKIDRFMEYENN